MPEETPVLLSTRGADPAVDVMIKKEIITRGKVCFVCLPVVSGRLEIIGAALETWSAIAWLNLFNAELSPKRYWRRPRSQEVRWVWGGGRGGGELYLTLHCHHQNDSCIKMARGECHFIVCFIRCEGQSHKTVSINHNCWKRKDQSCVNTEVGLGSHSLSHSSPRL